MIKPRKIQDAEKGSFHPRARTLVVKEANAVRPSLEEVLAYAAVVVEPRLVEARVPHHSDGHVALRHDRLLGSFRPTYRSNPVAPTEVRN